MMFLLGLFIGAVISLYLHHESMFRAWNSGYNTAYRDGLYLRRLYAKQAKEANARAERANRPDVSGKTTNV